MNARQTRPYWYVWVAVIFVPLLTFLVWWGKTYSSPTDAARRDATITSVAP